MRLFVAVELEPIIKARLKELVDDLTTAGADVKWVEEDNFHLTLYFIGEVKPTLAAKVKEELAFAATGMPFFRFTLKGVGAFPNLTQPRVLWVGVSEGQELWRLHQRVSQQLNRLLGTPAPSPDFAPHVTLGRVRSPRRLPALAKLLDEHREEYFGRQEVKSFSLMESRLRREGPVYTRLSVYPLGQAG